MLNKHEMAMAQELAQELIEVNHLKEKEQFDTAFDSLKSIFDSVKERFTEVWSSIRETFDNIHETRERIEHQNTLRESWHIPIKMDLPKSPFIENHNLQFARSNI